MLTISYQNRRAVQIENQRLRLTVLEGGGHIAGLQHKPTGVNPLWIPPWPSIEPSTYDPALHPEYGNDSESKLLAGIMGHNLCLDTFGGPSAEEAAAGMTVHGEAPVVRHRIAESAGGLIVSADLPEAQLAFERRIRLEGPWVRISETVENLSALDRPVAWTEHVTIGPPFLACGDTLVDMPATRAKVNPASYSDAMMITPDADFQWPQAPLQGGGFHDLRTTPDGCYLRYTAQLLDPSRAMGYTAIANPSAGLLLVYVFRRTDFPWVGNWEERFYLKTAPWGGKTFCRGIEFSSTPLAVPKRQTVSQGPLFNESTYRWLPALSETTVRYMTLLVDIPADFQGVEDVSVEAARIVIREAGNGKTYSLPADGSFLRGEAAGLR